MEGINRTEAAMDIAEYAPRRFAAGCLIVTLGSALASASLAPAPPPPAALDARVSIQLKNASLSTFLDVMSSQTKANFIIEKGLDDEHVTAFFRDVPAREALSALLEAHHLQYRKAADGNIYIISAQGTSDIEKLLPPPSDALNQRISVTLRSAPLRSMLEDISAQAKINFILGEGLDSKQITAHLANVSVRQTLAVLAEMKGLSFRKVPDSETYMVEERSK
jgi:type II secretory pathway component GspD/PulD (secretin)